MEIRRLWILRGPNLWSSFPVLELELDLGKYKDISSEMIPGFNDRLKSWLPSMIEHRCSIGERGGFFQRLDRGTYLAHILEHVTLELQSIAGNDVGYGRARETDVDGVYKVAIEFDEEEVGKAAVEAGIRVCLAAVQDTPIDIAAEVAKLKEIAHEVCLGPSTMSIVKAARARGIPRTRLNRESLVQLGHAAKSRRVLTAETDQTGAIAEAIASDKQLTRTLLKSIGAPVPEGRPVKDAEDAWQVAQELGLPVVVKPQFGNHGRGVATNLTTEAQVVAAYHAAREEGRSIMVETFAPGEDHRLLVIGGKLIAAALREPAQVVGNGRSTITELVAEVNRDPRRSDGHSTVLSFIKLDPVGLAVLGEQGFTPDSVPPAGKVVLIRRNGNLSTGGTATDVTDRVHPEVAARAIDAARMVGLDIAGVDIVALDIGRPLEEQRAAIVEVNAGPGLRMHIQPSAGKGRAVGEAIVDMLFPPESNGRIPLVAITGVNGKTTTTRLIAHILRGCHKTVGMTCTDGLFINDRRIESRDCSGPQSARAVLMNPQVDAAVFETARGGILREGLGYDRSHVGVVTNIGSGDHLGLRGISTLEELARVKRVVVEAVAKNGATVLNAEDPLVAEMAEKSRAEVIYFARSADGEVVAKHRIAGGRAVIVRAGSMVLATGAAETVLAPLVEIPLTHGGKVGFQVENALAAAAAAWGLGLSLDVIREGLRSFTGSSLQTPGRFNVFDTGGATIIVDYAHNPSALAALAEGIEQLAPRPRTIVLCGFDRRDEDIVEVGRVIGGGFDRVILYKDSGNRERRDGELNEILKRGLVDGGRAKEVLESDSETAAIELALSDLKQGDVVVIGTESIEPTLEFIDRYLAARK